MSASRSSASAASSSSARSLSARAEALGAEIDVLHGELTAARDEPVRWAGFRCEMASGPLREAAGELRDTAADLDRIAAAAAPGTSSVQWGACPEHGNTLVSGGGRTWCRDTGCKRTWRYDRVGPPCTEPVRWRMIDQHGGAILVCHGHAVAVRAALEHMRIVPLAVEWRKGQG
jgi:hypothetical protein